MDELTLIRDFRSEVPAPSADSVRTARAALAARMSRAPWWRRRLVVAIAIALVAAVGAGAALGLGDRLVDLIRGKPAPDQFQRMMAISHSRTVFGRGPVTGPWRGVTATQTPIGPAGIWVAPEESGGICWHAVIVDPEVTVVRGHVIGACGASQPRGLLEGGVQGYEDTGRFTGKPTGRSFKLLVGRVGRGATSVDAYLCGRRTPLRVPVRETFMLHALSAEAEVRRLVAFDENGRRLGETVPPHAPPFNGCP
jgi:hypothetical protein